jgi:hypothetical protein
MTCFRYVSTIFQISIVSAVHLCHSSSEKKAKLQWLPSELFLSHLAADSDR